MANVVAKARSNLFRVKAALREPFIDIMAGGGVQVEDGPDDMVVLFSETECGDWPVLTQDMDDAGVITDLPEDAEGIAVAEMIQRCIEPGDVAIIVQASSEGFRYVGGWGAAITSDRIEAISFVDWLTDKAKEISGKATVIPPHNPCDPV